MWANVVKQAPAPAASEQARFTSTDGCKVVVVDANAIINGIRLEGIADKAVTIQEVLDEVRDKQSRQFLATLAIKLEVAEPSEESVKAVTRFARETGDIHALSRVDILLLALAHTLEASTHGTGHLKEHPNQPLLRSRHRAAGKALPGWGRVDNPEDWAAVDAANEEDEAAANAAAAGASRIAAHVQQLRLDGAPGSGVGALADEKEETNGAAADLSTPAAAAPAAGHVPPGAGRQQQKGIGNGAAAAAEEEEEDSSSDDDSGDEGEGAGGDEDGWEVATKSQGAARRRRRKEARRAQRQAEFEAEWDDHSRLMQQRAGDAAGDASDDEETAGDEMGEAGVTEPEQLYGPAGVFADEEEDDEGEEEGEEEEETEGQEAAAGEEAAAAAASAAAGESGAASAATAAAAAAGASAVGQTTVEDGGAWERGTAANGSSIATMTADYAMQNVLLQMGLRLLSRDGRIVSRLSRWALRCSACFFVTREAGRLFCPKCGNMALDRVEMAVGADGAEYYGVRKRHILRGTRYSLPKPRGGRNSSDPILREDVFLLKVKALGPRRNKKPAAPKPADAGDPLEADGTEFGEGRSQAQLAQHRGLAAVLEPAWKRNPNERKLTRTNRRR